MAAILLRRGDHLSGSENQFDFPSHVVIQIARALCWHSPAQSGPAPLGHHNINL